ncbi:aspartate kinase [Tepidibacter hydrothermalis]|uniref:Aspartokinase n=1 Tax=Tepidibacter hydrothermalis TaxID=3036126 RepID=A0ABY8E7M5_9FIRM|nr:aspartate kinase [Tepidibacter hydrothermalis]WFD08900.1 aspartate kinase [Tepidibacter hydrothermalis]
MKNIVVQKYGGSSVGSIDRIKNVAKQVVKAKHENNKVVVVVSAMGNTTNELIEKAIKINKNPSSREMDMLLSTGEQMSIALLAMAIQELNEDVISLNGYQCKIITDDKHKKARISDIDTTRIKNELQKGKIVIVAGFQGVSQNNDITTLGRGGSDTTAVALAAILNATKCEIYTDVDGVYTSDPRIVKGAKLLEKISYDEMLELASLGAKVLHPRCVELARKYNVALVVKSSFNECKGTEVVEVNKVENVLVRGVSLDEKIAKVSILEVPDEPGISYQLFDILSKYNIQVDMIIQNVNRENVNDISFTVNTEDLKEVQRISNELKDKINAKDIVTDESVSKISVVGIGISGSSNVASAFFRNLYELGVNIQMISTSEIKISCIIDKKKGREALEYVNQKFRLCSDNYVFEEKVV